MKYYLENSFQNQLPKTILIKLRDKNKTEHNILINLFKWPSLIKKFSKLNLALKPKFKFLKV